MKASTQLIDFIRGKEQFRAEVYDDYTGKPPVDGKFIGTPTIGYGDTAGDMSRPITEEEAYKRKINRVALAESELGTVVTRTNLQQSQQDALIDAHYNLGLTRMVKSGLIDLVNQGRDEEVAKSMRNFNKARNNETGQLEVRHGLVTRADQRAQMYSGNGTIQAVPMKPVSEAPRDLDADIAAFNAQEEQSQQVPQDNSMLDAQIKQFEMSENSAGKLQAGDLRIAADAADGEQLQQVLEAQKVSKETGAPFDIVIGMMTEGYKPQEIRAKAKIGEMERYAPSAAAWARNPDNFAVFQKTEDWPITVDAAAKSLMAERSDVSKAWDRGLLTMSEVATSLGLLGGTISTEEAGHRFAAISREKSALEINRPDVKELQKKWEDYVKNDGSLWDVVAFTAQRPAAVGLQSIESALTSGIPFGLSIAGIVAPPVAPYAVGGAFLSGAAVSFGTKFREQLDAFMDKDTGEIDMVKAFSDPDRVARWQKEALLYGVVMGVFDAAYGLVAGKLFPLLSKAGGAVAGKTVGKALGATGEISSGPISEGLSEVAATTAGDAYAGRLTSKKWEENKRAGHIETLMSIPVEGGFGPIAHGVRKLAPHSKIAALKTIQVAQDGVRAVKDSAAVSNLRATVEKHAKEFPNQAKDLVDRVTQKARPTSVEPVVNEDNAYDSMEAKGLAEVDELNSTADEGVVHISPLEWIDYHESRGVDPYAMAQLFGQEVHEQFMANAESDTSFTVPVSDWILKIQNDPELDSIARFGDNKYNAEEANEALAALDENPFALFSKDDIAELPPLPGTEELPPLPTEEAAKAPPVVADGMVRVYHSGAAGTGEIGRWVSTNLEYASSYRSALPLFYVDLLSSDARVNHDTETYPEGGPKGATFNFELTPEEALALTQMPRPPEEATKAPAENKMNIIEATEAEGNAVLRPVDLVGKFRTDEERQVFGGLKRKLQKIGKELKLAPESVEAFADVQMERLKHRADVMNRSIKELYENTKIGVYNQPYANHLGFFSTNRIIGNTTLLKFNKGIKNQIDTVIHEWGHSWLHEMAEDFHFIKDIAEESRTPAQKEYAFAMNKAAELLGLDNIQQLLNMPQAEYVKMHEGFAQTTEIYFLEGKYENSKVRQTMELFRGWIVRTLQYIKMMANTYPTFKLDPEVERMYEGILGTSQAIEEAVIPMFTPQMFDDKFLGADAQRYQDAWADAQSEAVGRTYLKGFLRPMREREKLIRESTARFQAEAAAEVDALPSMQFLKVSDEAYGAYKRGEIKQDPRLSYESVQEVLLGGNEKDVAWLKDKLPASTMTGKKKGGIDVREFMYANGITDPSVVLDMLVETTKRDALVDERINKKIDEEMPVTKTDEELHKLAVDAVNGKGKQKLLALEVKILAEKSLAKYRDSASQLMKPPVGATKISVADLQIEAKALVNDAAAFKFSPDKFLRDSQRMARESSRAFKKNDFVDAFNYKRREAVAFMAFREAQKAQKILAVGRQIAKTIQRYAPSRAAMKTVDTDIIKFGYHLIQNVTKGEKLINLSDIQISPFSGVTQEHISGLIDMRGLLIGTMGSRVGKNISVEGGMVFADMMRAIMFVAKEAKSIEVAGNSMPLEEAAGSFTKVLNKDGPVVSYKRDGIFSASTRRAGVHKMDTGLASLYPSSEAYVAGPIGALRSDIRDGEARVGLTMTDAENRLHARLKNLVGSKGIKSVKENIFAPLQRFSETKPIIGKEIGFNFQNEGALVMGLATALGSESGLIRFLSSLKPGTDEQVGEFDMKKGEWDTAPLTAMVDRMIADGTLRKEHFELMQEIWNIFGELKGPLTDAIRKSDGVQMGNIEGVKFSNTFGEWTGGYVPVAQDSSGIDASLVNKGLLSVDSSGYSFGDLYPTMANGFTKTRNATSTKALELDLRKVLNYVSAASKMINLRKPMQDFGKILKRPDVAAALQARRPDFVKNVVVPWFDYTVDQTYTDPDTHVIHTIAGKLRRNANTVMYLGGIASAVRQLYGLAPSAQIVGGRNIKNSLIRMGTSVENGKAMFTQARDESVFMRERMRGSVKKHVKSNENFDVNFDWWSQMGDTRDKLTYMMSQATQNITDVATWHAAIAKAEAQGLDRKAAIRFADKAVVDSQGSPNVSDMSAIQRGSNAYRLATMVTSVPIAISNAIAEELMRLPEIPDSIKEALATTEGREALSNKIQLAASMGAVMVLLPLMLESGVGIPFSDDEPEEIIKGFASKTFAGFLDSAFPIVSRPVTGFMAYGQPSVSPALSKLTQSARAPGIAGRTMDGIEATPSETALLLESFTLYTGIPVSVIGRLLKAYDNAFTSTSDKKQARRVRGRQMRVIRRRNR